MTIAFGVSLALVALVAWGVADFLIQRSARLAGIVMTMFFIGAVAVVGFLPFVFQDLFSLSLNEVLLLFGTGVTLTIASLLDFEALKEGKMAIAEPVIGLETPLTVLFAVLIAGERLPFFHSLLIILVFTGTFLVITKRFSHFRGKRVLEKGVLMALLAAVGLAASNFLVGESSQNLSPFLAIWCVGFAHMLVCFIVLGVRGELHNIARNLRAHPWTMLGQAFVDNIAWIAFAGAATLIPISIAATISSGYVALAVLLGIFITRERVNAHQFAGIVLICLGITALSYFYG